MVKLAQWYFFSVISVHDSWQQQYSKNWNVQKCIFIHTHSLWKMPLNWMKASYLISLTSTFIKMTNKSGPVPVFFTQFDMLSSRLNCESTENHGYLKVRAFIRCFYYIWILKTKQTIKNNNRILFMLWLWTLRIWRNVNIDKYQRMQDEVNMKRNVCFLLFWLFRMSKARSPLVTKTSLKLQGHGSAMAWQHKLEYLL